MEGGDQVDLGAGLSLLVERLVIAINAGIELTGNGHVDVGNDLVADVALPGARSSARRWSYRECFILHLR